MLCPQAAAQKKKGKTDRSIWKQFVGQKGPSGWRANVIQPDPQDHGPDGFNHHDWDGDGDVDINDVRGLQIAWLTRQPLNPAFDLNGNGRYDIGDVRALVTMCTNARCAP